MNSKTTSIAAAGLVLIAGGTMLWNRMRDDDPPAPNVAVEGHAGKTSDRGDASVPAGRPGVERNLETGSERPATEGTAIVESDGMTSHWVERASEGFEQTREHLVTDLELPAAQAKGVEEVFVRREKQLESLLAGMTSGEEGDDAEIVRRICALIRNKGLREDLVGVLSTAELAAFDAREAKRERDAIEARAYRDMAEINSVVQLADSQKPDVFGVLLEQAPERVEQEADARAFMSLTYGPLATDMDSPAVRRLANIFNVDPTQNPALGDYGSPEHQQWVEKRKAERIENELSTLKGVLAKDQLERYRKHLELQMPW